MSIEGYIGRPGSGKSYAVTERVLAARSKNPERPIFCNFRVRGTTYFEVDDWIHLPPGLVVLDEAHLLFSSRAAMRLPGKWLEVLSQTRHRGWDIIWATQHERRVDSALKDLTDFMWLCTSWWGSPGSPPLLLNRRCFEPEDFRKKGAHLVSQWRRFNPSVAAAYSTHEMVRAAKHLQED